MLERPRCIKSYRSLYDVASLILAGERHSGVAVRFEMRATRHHGRGSGQLHDVSSELDQ